MFVLWFAGLLLLWFVNLICFITGVCVWLCLGFGLTVNSVVVWCSVLVAVFMIFSIMV